MSNLNLNNLGKKQIEILKNSKIFLKKNQSYSISADPRFFLASWSDGLGKESLKKISKEKSSFLKILYEMFKCIFANNYIKRMDLSLDNLKKKNYENIIISYLDEKNFKSKHVYYDKYFNFNANELRKTILILIPTNKKKHTSLFHNTAIINLTFRNFFLNFLISFFKFINVLGIYLINKKKYSLNLAKSNFNHFLIREIYKTIEEKKIKKIIFPYEAQPHQHELTNFLKKNTKIKINGYMHTVLPPLPTDYIKREGSPHQLIVNGKIQKNILCKYLGWKKSEIKSISSPRYKNESKKKFQNKIFLPIDFDNKSHILREIEDFIKSAEKNFLPKFSIRNHPAKSNSKKHNKLIEEINKILNINKFKFRSSKKNRNYSVFIGSTASIIECLERGLIGFHICERPLFECYHPELWKSVKIKKILNNSFKYVVKNRQKIIKFGKNNRKEYLNCLK